ncbi:TonB-dependent receptor [Lysobacter sp. LF1]|uniref:TonB-dependent receptor n=1 Tax=Lysobacter stagni TaxID=3045172 RepID=A0ABT6XB23_9GAMM|nr:TonB-dependent receptor [Lysobacter sp. LF1]MDI9237302.1 TonB-dependent receptor [Lysobacter sp. LF1]
MIPNRSKLRDAIVLALALAATSIAPRASAQDAASSAQSATDLDTVTVTGTRIQSQTVTASSPVAEIDREEFKVTGTTRVEDLVNQMPQLTPYFDSFSNNGATGYPTASLRGLGNNRTLTLINGQRSQAGGTDGGVDLSQVPSGLIKRVDILTGGASAVYGADAVAGVVNFVLDDEFEGFQVNLGYSAFQHDNDSQYLQGLMDKRGFGYPTGNSGLDGKSRNIDLIWGSSLADGQGHASAWLTWRRNDPLFQGERDYSSCALNASGTACGGSATAARPNFFVFDAADTLAASGFGAHLNPNGSWAAGTDDVYNFAPINYYQRPEDRLNAGASLKLEVNEHFRPFIDLMFTHRTSSTQIAESGTFFAQDLSLPCSDPLLGTMCGDLGLDASGPLTINVGKRNVEGGPRFWDTKSNSYRVVAGAEGAIDGSWTYNVSGIFGRTDRTAIGINDFLSDRVEAALLGCPPGSFPGCSLYNVWKPNGVTKQAADQLAGVSTDVTETSLTGVSGYVSGDLGVALPWAGGDTVSLVSGAEWRREELHYRADSNSEAGNFAGSGGTSPPISGQTEVKELFAEAAVPILKDAGIVDRFNLDLGYRYSDYDRSGSASTYKVGFGGDFLDHYKIRGGYNRAIRAPVIVELFSPQSLGLFSGADECAGTSPTLSLAECQRTGVTAAQYGKIPDTPAGQYNQYTGGDPDLTPEEADTYTLGFVASPVRGLDVAVDYFDIRIDNRIDSVGAQNILNGCATSGVSILCDRIHRNPASGDLWLGSTGYIENQRANIGNQQVRGIDLNASYRWEMFGGRALVSLVGTRELAFKVEPLPGVDSFNYDCTGLITIACQNPKWRHIANIRYSRDAWSVNLRWRYYGSLAYRDELTGEKSTTDKLLARNDGIDAYNWFDLSGTFQFGSMAEWTVGVNNLFDKAPPMVGNTLADNANAPQGYDQAGRYFFTSVNLKF